MAKKKKTKEPDILESLAKADIQLDVWSRDVLLEILRKMGKIDRKLAEIERLLKQKHPKLKSIAIYTGDPPMQGPLTLNVGQSTVATVLGYDQNGQPFPIDFTATPVSWSLDQPSFDSLNPNPDGSAAIQSLAEGTATLTATVGSFSDSTQILNVAVTPPTPVLSSIKIDFSPAA